MTHGDMAGCKCPACKKTIAKPIGDIEPERGKIVERTINCPHCRCVVRFWARWSVAVEMERESRVK